MYSMKSFHSHTLIGICIVLIVSILILFPLCQPGFIQTDDGDWMVIRLSAFYQAFADGQFPVRFLGRLNNNYGYPVANFLYPGFLYIGSLIRLFHVPYQTIVEFILGISVVASGIFLFLWLKKFFSYVASCAGAVSFLISPYFLYDLYKRGSVGELLSAACAIGLFWIIESELVFLIPPVAALFLLSHNTASFLFGILIIGYVILRKKWNAIIPLGIGVAMTLFFWIPALAEQQYVQFFEVAVANPFDYAGISSLLARMSMPFLVPCIFLFIWKKKWVLRREYIFFCVVTTVAIFFSSPLGMKLWEWSLFERLIQFPYRLLTLVFIAGPWLLAFLFHTVYKKQQFLWIGVLLGILAVVSVPFVLHAKNATHEEGFYTTNEATTTVQDEYMPKWAREQSKERAFEKLNFFSGNGTITITKQTTKIITAHVQASQESVLRFNTIYYPGWGAMLDGKPVAFSYDNPQGLMQVSIPPGEHDIVFEFRETGLRYIADTLSSIAILGYGVYLIWYISKGVKRK